MKVSLGDVIVKRIMADLPVQPVIEFTCRGTPYQMGLAQGDAFADKIRESFQTVAELEAFRLKKPFGLPFGMFRQIAERKARRFVDRAFAVSPISARERLQGLADGARVPFRKVALCAAMEAVLGDLRPITTTNAVPKIGDTLQAGCSAMAVSKTATQTGDPILAHNFDYLPVTQPYYFIRRSQPAGKLKSVELSLAPAIGVVDGINEAGLSITCNYAFTTDKTKPAPTITMLISEAMANCRTVEDAVEYFQTSPRVGGGLLMLGDSRGTIASLEISSTRCVRRDPADGRDRLCHTNRFCCSATCEVELSESAVYGQQAPAVLRGRRVHQSSDERNASFQARMESYESFDEISVRDVMSDHGPHGTPSSDTVCMHGNYWFTTASIQLFPAERKLHASFSPTCVAKYHEFAVEGS
ncbi:MAG TPA: C45 family peptidase [Planctomycetaceae bacterium]|nr:C45 family peptidase [Planctomycetaceae bacterium]